MTETAEFIFVFGSNKNGWHGRGSAAAALNEHGAIYGQAKGRQGNSYAIPTKDHKLKSLPLYEIKIYVEEFLNYAKLHSDLNFLVVRIGTGLAGFTDEEIAPLFRYRSDNVTIHDDWVTLLEEMYQKDQNSK